MSHRTAALSLSGMWAILAAAGLLSIAACTPSARGLTEASGGGVQDSYHYPAARLDTAVMAARRLTGEVDSAEAQARGLLPMVETMAYTTSDGFNEVISFYEARGRRVPLPFSTGEPPRLSNGERVREQAIVLDTAHSFASANRWVIVQRPGLGNAVGMDNGNALYDTIWEATMITHYRRIGGKKGCPSCGKN